MPLPAGCLHRLTTRATGGGGAARRGDQLVATVPAGRRARGSRRGEGEGTIHAIPQWILIIICIQKWVSSFRFVISIQKRRYQLHRPRDDYNSKALCELCNNLRSIQPDSWMFISTGPVQHADQPGHRLR
uniref:Uncharacterized protein n=1 Tax=Oryza nivara TaxID=4536 RepID=A0A0E0I517_ORYNI